MKIAGLNMNDVWGHRVLRERGVDVSEATGLEAEIGVQVEQIWLDHHGPETNYRPYLHLGGELRSVVLPQRLPHGIDEVVYPVGGGQKVDAYYEFTDSQLAALAAKGYFGRDFITPEQVTGIEWELPATVDVRVLAPQSEQDVPVVFVGVRDVASLSINEHNSGYDVAKYFADFSREDGVRLQEAVHQDSFRTPSTMDSLFTEEDLNDLPSEEAEATDPEHVQEGFAAQAREVEADLDAREAAQERELEETEGTPEHTYRYKVAGAVAEQDEPGADALPEPIPATDQTPQTEESTLDLDEEEDVDLTPPPVKIGRHSASEESAERTRRDLAARVAELERTEHDEQEHQF